MRNVSDETKLSVNSFIPDERMIRAKLRLQRHVPPNIISKLTVASLDMLREHVGEDVIDNVQTWCVHYKDFLEWLVSPDEFDVELYQARRTAVSVVTQTLNYDVYDAKSGKLDAKIAALKYKAASDILSKDPVGQGKSSTTYKVTNNLGLGRRQPPKVLTSKTLDQLEAEYQKLDQKSSLEGEIAI